MAAALLLPSGAAAQFAAFVQPARFELKARAGETVREVLDIGNDGQASANFSVRSADWILKPDGGVEFRADTLATGSCRPWVRVERYQVKVAGKSKRRFRFEVQVPGEAPAGLCRFALLVESLADAASVAPSGNINMPIQGRVAVIVYVRIGGAKPDLRVEGMRIDSVNGQPTPVVVLRNEGNAHGRPEGVLSGTDAKGLPVDLIIASMPVLPGETRAVPVWPSDRAERKSVTVTFPIKLTGRVEWEGGSQDIDTTLAP